MDNHNIVNIFISYSDADQAYIDELDRHFSVMRDPNLKIWWKGLVEAGAEPEKVIQKQIDEADIILLLISSDFFDTMLKIEDSRIIPTQEYQKAIEKHRTGSARVIPIILRSCGWTINKDISQLKPLPGDGKPIVKWEIKDDAYTNVVLNVQNTILKIRETRDVKPEVNEPDATPELVDNQKEVWEESKPHEEQITYQASHEENDFYNMPGDWKPVIQEPLQTSNPPPTEENFAQENRDEQEYKDDLNQAVVRNSMELKMGLEQIANQYGYELTEYVPNKFKIKVFFKLKDNSFRSQTVFTWIADIGRNKKPCIYINSRVGIYNENINLYNIAYEAAFGLYSSVTIADDTNLAGDPCESIIVQAAPNLEHTNYELFKEILVEVATQADLLEEKFFGKDIN